MSLLLLLASSQSGIFESVNLARSMAMSEGANIKVFGSVNLARSMAINEGIGNEIFELVNLAYSKQTIITTEMDTDTFESVNLVCSKQIIISEEVIGNRDNENILIKDLNMDLLILNSAFQKVGIIDTFESLIWTDRYYEAGDFELVTSPTSSILNILNQGAYAAIERSEHLMIIEDVHIKTDPVNGNKLITKGRSFESVLDRRIIWDYVIFETEPIQYSIFTLLNEAVLNPSDSSRKMNNLIFEFSQNPIVLSIRISNQYWGNNLYKAVVDLCFSNNIGLKIVFDEEGTGKIQLYSGVDRSYDQVEYPYVIFSPRFENLKNSEYMLSRRLLKTTSLVAGEKGVGNARVVIEVDPSQGTILDLYRREMFLDAQNITSVDRFGNSISAEEYFAHLYQKGLEELAKNVNIETFASEVDPSGEFIFGRDFFLGDILQVSNEYGYEGKSRVIEVVRAQDGSGFKIYPIFAIVSESKNIDEVVFLDKNLTISCPQDISEVILLGKKLEYIDGINEVIDFIIFSDMYTNGRFD